MKKLMIAVAALLMVGCKAPMDTDQQLAAEKYCTKNGLELVTLTNGWDFGKAYNFGCRKEGEHTYSIVPDYVTRKQQ